MKIFIVRHAETIENSKKIINGWKHGNLSETGSNQARKLANYLKSREIDLIYCSDLDRCKKTIEPFLKLKKTPIIYTEKLRERCNGIFDGKPREEFVEWANKNNLDTDLNKKWQINMPDGETFQEVRERTSSLISEILKIQNKKNILIVTHAQSKVALLLNIFNQDEKDNYAKYRSKNTGLSIVNISEENEPVLETLNSLNHLN